MDYLPIFVRLTGLSCLVVGGGEVAWRKATMLKKAGAEIILIAPDACLNVQQAALRGELLWRKEHFILEHLKSIFLVICATDDPFLNETISTAARKKNILANVVDDRANCSFIMPAIVDRNPIIIAISSGGKAPVLTRLLREKLETLVPFYLGRMAILASEFREKLKQRINSFALRRQFWEAAFHGRFSSLVSVGDEKGAKAQLVKLMSEMSLQGEVTLIGAGPGDPSLLTLRALQSMQQADVILHDYLVSKEIINLCRKDAQIICVGKKAACHSVSQEQINAQLIEHAKAGKRVVRLKGGDPFIFGRGAEELQALQASNIPFQVVPGITAAAGVCAYAGIPLTHRDYAQTAMFITGHQKIKGNSLHWASLAKEHQTLVIYMGLMKSAYIEEQLILHGRAPQTPVAIIENGTLLSQKIYQGTLSELSLLAQKARSPALIVVGEVVELSQQLSWFAKQQNDDNYHEKIPAAINLE